MKQSKKFTEQLLCVVSWIQTRKKFLFLSPDYVVVGLSMKEYLKHFPSRDIAKKEYQLVIDEAEKVDDEVWEKLSKKLYK